MKTSSMLIQSVLALCIALVTLLLPGCGGGSDGNDPPSVTTPPTRTTPDANVATPDATTADATPTTPDAGQATTPDANQVADAGQPTPDAETGSVAQCWAGYPAIVYHDDNLPYYIDNTLAEMFIGWTCQLHYEGFSPTPCKMWSGEDDRSYADTRYCALHCEPNLGTINGELTFVPPSAQAFRDGYFETIHDPVTQIKVTCKRN